MLLSLILYSAQSLSVGSGSVHQGMTSGSDIFDEIILESGVSVISEGESKADDLLTTSDIPPLTNRVVCSSSLSQKATGSFRQLAGQLHNKSPPLFL